MTERENDNGRRERALKQKIFLLERGFDKRTNEVRFKVVGSTGNVYTIIAPKFEHRESGEAWKNFWKCSCPDNSIRHKKCKHILFIEIKALGYKENKHPGLLNAYKDAKIFVEMHEKEELYDSYYASYELQQKYKNLQGEIVDQQDDDDRITQELLNELSEDASYSEISEQVMKKRKISDEKKVEIVETKEKIKAEHSNCLICFDNFDDDPEFVYCDRCKIVLHRMCWSEWFNHTKLLGCIHCKTNDIPYFEPQHDLTKREKHLDEEWRKHYYKAHKNEKPKIVYNYQSKYLNVYQ